MDTLLRIQPSSSSSSQSSDAAAGAWVSFYHGVVTLVWATRKVKMFPNLSERKCTISHDCVCSHATLIQSELVENHMHAFQKGEVEEKEDDNERGAGSFI